MSDEKTALVGHDLYKCVAASALTEVWIAMRTADFYRDQRIDRISNAGSPPAPERHSRPSNRL